MFMRNLNGIDNVDSEYFGKIYDRVRRLWEGMRARAEVVNLLNSESEKRDEFFQQIQ